MSMDPRIEAVREKYGLAQTDFWQIPQNKQWVCKHAALEVVATKANVEWDAPQVIEARTADGIAVLAVSGKLGNRVEWSTGEASPKNNKNGYPWAMAEKRAKDRVVLKLVGIHGLVYSEDEMPTTEAPANDTPTKSSAALKRAGSWEELKAELDSDFADCHSLLSLDKLRADYREKARNQGWTKAWLGALGNEFDNFEDGLKAAEAKNSTLLAGE